MRENFTPALACVLVHEGGKDDDPRDPGGRTAYGVIQRRYDQYRVSKGLPKRDVWSIEPAERSEIYKTMYWDVILGDRLPAGTDYAVFDGCVNSGDMQAAKWLQRAINDVRAGIGRGPIAVDGRIGEGTIVALNEIEDQDKVIAALQGRRLAMLKNLKTWKYFGNGWGRRVREVQAAAQGAARGSAPLPLSPIWAKAGGKALLSDAKPLPSPTGGAIAGTVGTVTSATTAVTTSAAPIQGVNPWIDHALQALLIVGAVAAAAGGLWAVYAARKARERAEALDIAVPEAPVA